MEAFTKVPQNFILPYNARTLYTISANTNYVQHAQAAQHNTKHFFEPPTTGLEILE
jgi:hypothetical protein